MQIEFETIAGILGFVGLIASLYTFLQRQREMVKKQSSQFERFKFDLERIQEMTSTDKLQEYYKLQARVEDNGKRINDLEVNVKEELNKLNEKFDTLILNLTNEKKS